MPTMPGTFRAPHQRSRDEQRRDHDRRRDRDEPHRKWQKTYRWQKLRAKQLHDEPLCRMCEAEGAVTIATVCDHIEPHRGDEAKFWAGPFQSLCSTHHSREKQREEQGTRPTRR